MDKRVVIRIDSKVCALTVILAIVFSATLAFCMYNLILRFYETGSSSSMVAKFIFVVYPIIFLSVAFTLAGYLMIVGTVDEPQKKKK